MTTPFPNQLTLQECWTTTPIIPKQLPGGRPGLKASGRAHTCSLTRAVGNGPPSLPLDSSAEDNPGSSLETKHNGKEIPRVPFGSQDQIIWPSTRAATHLLPGRFCRIFFKNSITRHCVSFWVTDQTRERRKRANPAYNSPLSRPRNKLLLKEVPVISRHLAILARPAGCFLHNPKSAFHPNRLLQFLC